MSAHRIPVTSHPDTTLQVSLGGTPYLVRLRWSARGESWHFDLHTVAGEPIAFGVRIVTGWPLLRRNKHAARPPGEIYCPDTRGESAEPTEEELGTRFQLFYVDAEGVS